MAVGMGWDQGIHEAGHDADQELVWASLKASTLFVCAFQRREAYHDSLHLVSTEIYENMPPPCIVWVAPVRMNIVIQALSGADTTD